MSNLTRHFVPVGDEIGKSHAETYDSAGKYYSIVTTERALAFRDEYGGRFVLASARKMRQIIYLAIAIGYALGRLAT